MCAMSLSLMAGSAFGQCQFAAMPAQSGPFPGNTRGYVFTAPVDFRITGVNVLLPPGSVNQFANFAIVRHVAEPPFFPAVTNDFTSLVTMLDQPAGGFVPVDVEILTGDIIGIYGNTAATASAASGTNSYATPAGGSFTEVLGNMIDLRRSGMQFHLSSNNPANSMMHDVWRETAGNTGSITRIEFCYEAGGACYPDCDTQSGPGILDIFDFLCFGNRFTANDPYACDCDTQTGVGVCDIFDFLCFGNAFTAGCP
jgi:hypothetical protein